MSRHDEQSRTQASEAESEMFRLALEPLGECWCPPQPLPQFTQTELERQEQQRLATLATVERGRLGMAFNVGTAELHFGQVVALLVQMMELQQQTLTVLRAINQQWASVQPAGNDDEGEDGDFYRGKAEAAAALGFSVSFLEKLAAAGEFCEPIRVSSRLHLYRKSDVAEWLEARKRKGNNLSG